jgi:hypothetical protein
MKKQIQLIMAMVMVIPMLSFANPIKKTWDFEKTKTIKKEFTVNANALLKINNKYGNVDVISWDQNKVEIEVTITVKGNSESKVMSRLEKIDVNFTNSPNEVVAKTMMENSSNSWFKSNDNMNYQIDYKVKMPVTNSADFSNDYGSISLNELKGKATINCDYGKIILGSLHHADNSINIDYTSDSEIEFMNGGNINADYSKLRVVKANRVELNADYTESVFENVGDLNFNCDYGKVETGNANIINGRGDYLIMRFGAIAKRLNIQADYGKIEVDKLMKGFESVSIHTDYAKIKIGLDQDVSFNFTAKLSYTGFDFDGDKITYLKKEVKSSSSYFEGFVNKENSGSTIEITSEYGGVNMYNN